MWVEVVRAKWRDPFSSLRRKKFELDQIKEFIRYPDQLACESLRKRKTQPVGIVTQPMPTERMMEHHG